VRCVCVCIMFFSVLPARVRATFLILPSLSINGATKALILLTIYSVLLSYFFIFFIFSLVYPWCVWSMISLIAIACTKLG